MYDPSLSKMYQGYGAMQKENKRCIPKEGMPHASACQKKENKRCIPKEGMPHAHKACQKKEREKRCIPKEGVPHTHKVCQKKEEKEKYSPYQKYYRGERIHIKEFLPPSTKNIHTLAHLDIKVYDLFLLWIRSLT